MLAFSMTPETAMEFYRRAAEQGAKTEAERVMILCQMAEEGLMTRVVHTDRTKDQYVADLAKNFDILDLRNSTIEPEETLDGTQCRWVWDSETGERVLMDLRTNKEIMRRPE